MFNLYNEKEVVFVKDNTIGDLYLYLREADFDAGNLHHYLFSLVDRRMKAIPDYLYTLTYRHTNDLGLKRVKEVDRKAYYVSDATKELFQVSNRIMTNNFPEEYSIVGAFIDVHRRIETIKETDFLASFKEVIWE